MSQLVPERRSNLGLFRSDPFAELEQMTDRMRQMLDQVFSGSGGRSGGNTWAPLVDVTENEDAYVMEADLPGVKRDDVTIEVVGSELKIHGETKDEHEGDGTAHQRMRRHGRFDYRFRLPDQADPDAIEARLSDGVLSVRVPKSEQAQRRRIELAS